MTDTNNVIRSIVDEKIFFRLEQMTGFQGESHPKVRLIVDALQKQLDEVKKMEGYSKTVLSLDEQIAITRQVKKILEVADEDVKSAEKEKIQVDEIVKCIIEIYPHVIRLLQKLQMSKGSLALSLLSENEFKQKLDAFFAGVAKNEMEMPYVEIFNRLSRDKGTVDVAKYYEASIDNFGAPGFVIFEPKKQTEKHDDDLSDGELSASSSFGGLGAAAASGGLMRFDDTDKLHIAVDDQSFESLDHAYRLICQFIDSFMQEQISAGREGICLFKFINPTLIQQYYIEQPGKFCTVYTSGLTPEEIFNFAENMSNFLKLHGVVAGLVASDAKNPLGRDDLPLHTSHVSYSESGSQKEALQELVVEKQRQVVEAYFQHIPASSRLYWKNIDTVSISQLIERACDKNGAAGFFNQSAVDTIKHLAEFGVNIVALQDREKPMNEKIRHVTEKITAYCRAHDQQHRL